MDIIKLLQNKLLSVYDGADTDCFNVGYLVKYDEEWFLLNCYDPYGKYDGFLLIKRDNITKIEIDSSYTKSLMEIIEVNNSNKLIHQEDLLNYVLEDVKDRTIITITIENEDNLVGKLIDCDKEFFVLDILKNTGEYDGKVIGLLNSINAIQFGNIENEVIEKNISIRTNRD